MWLCYKIRAHTYLIRIDVGLFYILFYIFYINNNYFETKYILSFTILELSPSGAL